MKALDQLTDEALVEIVLQGERTAFAEIVRRYQRQVYNLAYRLTNNPEDALDISQDIFLHLYRVLDKFDRQRSFFSWMYRVATNVCYSSLKRKPQETVALDNIIDVAPLVPESGSQPEYYLEDKEARELVQQAISDLPEKYRLPLVLRYSQELSYQEIALVLDLPVSTIETRLYRAKQLLQKRLALVLDGRVSDEMSRR